MRKERRRKGDSDSQMETGLDVVYIHDEIISKHDGWVLF
jgi:hypothetical protein